MRRLAEIKKKRLEVRQTREKKIKYIPFRKGTYHVAKRREALLIDVASFISSLLLSLPDFDNRSDPCTVIMMTG